MSEKSLSVFKTQTPIYFLSKIIGIAPYALTTDGKQTITIFSSVYAILWLCIYLFVYQGVVRDDVLWPKVKRYPFTTIIGHCLHLYLGIIMHFLCIFYSYVRVKYVHRFLVNLSKIDNDLNSIDKKNKLLYHKIYKFQLIMIFIGLFILFIVTLFDLFIFNELYNTEFVFSLVFSYVYTYLCAAVVQAQFISIVHNIYQRFKKINKFLNDIADVNEPTSNAVKNFQNNLNFIADENNITNKNQINTINLTTNYNKNISANSVNSLKTINQEDEKVLNNNNNNKFLVIVKDFFHLNSNNNNKKKNNDNEPEVDNTDKIELQYAKMLHKKMNELFMIHDRLCDLSEFINDAYSMQIVATISVCFVLTLFGLFFEIKVIFWAWSTNLKLVLVATSYVLWGIITCLIIYSILAICTAAREEANESALIIHKILQNKPVFMLNDEIYYNKMKSFTLQILHRKNTFHFNGLGLFYLDYTFIFSAVSAATSYLIVLLQFDLSYDLSTAEA